MKHSLRKSQGNMYEWVSHVWSPILGCSHQCTYCYVRRYHKLPENPILNEEDFPNLGKDRVIFVGHLCDMFSDSTKDDDILRVLEHAKKFPDNGYVFQTKNLAKLIKFWVRLPSRTTIGTTIETNRAELVAALSKAPSPAERAQLMSTIPGYKFLTIEPILDFDVDELTALVVKATPNFINIGADSKGHNLPEPSKEKILEFVIELQKAGVEIRKKVNLDRILEAVPAAR